MPEPHWIDVPGAGADLKALTWGPAGAPIALCLHGFPDTPYGWRKVAPRLAKAGWRVVAPFMRGYAPSSIPADGCYHVGALMHDALRVRAAAGGTDDDVVIGHDWGAIAATGLAAMPDSPFARAVIMSVPPAAAFRPLGRVPDRGRLARELRISCCAAGTSPTSSCPGCPSGPPRGYPRCCGAGGRRVITPRRICATSTPRSAHRRAGERR
ncbi:hypothetical protein NIIDMKKI_14110 [Mycobacterium kansasii]|uniref:AB hydrolase-1 domain-containing protein n=1 Tax=Mycobacterium kansasii TaxID=1768 RepID=A0A7G1I8T8_MYCKA|nr:hypothetical protein NIIDMKKI_14110 [Mycobacterium kansasii]